MERRDPYGQDAPLPSLQQLRAPGILPSGLSWGSAASSAAEGRGSSRQGSAVPPAVPSVVPSAVPSCAVPTRGCSGGAEAAPRLTPCSLCPLAVPPPRDLHSLHVSTLVLFLFHFPFVFSAVLSQFFVLCCLTSPLCSLRDFAPSLSPLAPLFSVCFPLFAPFPLLFLLIAYFHFSCLLFWGFFLNTLFHSFPFHLPSSFPLALFSPYFPSLSPWFWSLCVFGFLTSCFSPRVLIVGGKPACFFP